MIARTFVTLIIFGLLIAAIFAFTRQQKTVAGHIVDCETNAPISGAKVSAHQQGWGFDKYIIWDKPYVYDTTSDRNGYFKIRYAVGSSANLTAEKTGYLKAEQFENPGSNVEIKMHLGNKLNEVSYNCRLSSECLQTVTENNVQVTRNICLPQ